MKRKKQKKNERTFGFESEDECRIVMYELMRIYEESTNGKQFEVVSKYKDE